jgi:hypothetical protein
MSPKSRRERGMERKNGEKGGRRECEGEEKEGS